MNVENRSKQNRTQQNRIKQNRSNANVENRSKQHRAKQKRTKLNSSNMSVENRSKQNRTQQNSSNISTNDRSKQNSQKELKRNWKYAVRETLFFAGINKEYVSFGGGGPVVFDAMSSVDKGSSMDEGYNAGLPSRIVPLEAVPEQMSKAVPHSAQELISSQEIITDVDGMRSQKETATYLNRQEAGEVGLGREVPMQKANLLSPYGRELRYQGDSRTPPAGKGTLEARNGRRPGAQENFIGSPTNKDRFTGNGEEKSGDAPVSSAEHHDLEGIPTEAESDNEPFPEEAMSIASQVSPVDAVGVAHQLEVQQSENAARAQEATRMSQAEEMRPGEESRVSHSGSKNDLEGGSLGREDSEHNSRPHASLQSSNANHGNLKPDSASQEIYKASKGDSYANENANINRDSHRNVDAHNDVEQSHEYMQSHYADQAGLTGSPGQSNQKSGNEVTQTPASYAKIFDGQGKYKGSVQEGSSAMQVGEATSGNKAVNINNEPERKPGDFMSKSSKDLRVKEAGKSMPNSDGRVLQEAGRGNADIKESSNQYRQVPQHPPMEQEVASIGKGASFQEKEGKFSEPKVGFRETGSQEPLRTVANSLGHDQGTGGREASLRESGRKEPCKHCDIYPEVTYSLESSDAKAGPLKCKGCGPNVTFKPTVENISLNMSVSDKLVSSKQPQTMKPVPVPQTKGAISDKDSDAHFANSGKNGSVGTISSWENGATREASTSPARSEYHEQGALNDQRASWDQSESRGLSGPGGQTALRTALRTAHEQGDAGVLASGGNHNVASPTSTKPLALSQSNSPLLHDYPGNGDVMEFTNSKAAGTPSEQHNVERGESEPKRVSKQNDRKDDNKSKAEPVSRYPASKVSTDSETKGNSDAKPSSERIPVNSPAVKEATASRLDSRNASSNGKASNITTLVEIISKGMKALRESNFDIESSGKLRNGGTNETRQGDESRHQGNETESRNARIQTVKTKGDASSGFNGAEMVGAFRGAARPGQMVAQMHGEKQDQNTKLLDSSGIKGPDREKISDSSRFDPDGNFSDDSLQYPKHGWHEKNCERNPEQCKLQLSASVRPNENSSMDKTSQSGTGKVRKPDAECTTFFSLPDRQKRKLSKQKLKRYKKNCMQHGQEPLNVLDIKNDDGKLADKLKQGSAVSNAGQKAKNLDKINLSAAKIKIASLLSQETPEKSAPPGFRPGYTTMAFEHGAVIPDKKLEETPDTAETFVSRTARPDFSSLAGEAAGKSSDLAYYFNQKNEQKDKGMLMRAIPEADGASTATTNFNSPYGE